MRLVGCFFRKLHKFGGGGGFGAVGFFVGGATSRR